MVMGITVQAQSIKMTHTSHDGIPAQKAWKVSFPVEYDAHHYGSELEIARRDGNLYLIENKELGISVVFLNDKAVVFDYSTSGTEYYFHGTAAYKESTVSVQELDFCDSGVNADCEQKTKERQDYVKNAFVHYQKVIELQKTAQK